MDADSGAALEQDLVLLDGFDGGNVWLWIEDDPGAAAFVRRFMAATAAHRQALNVALEARPQRRCDVLLGYGQWLAGRALRSRVPSDVVRGLVAVALARHSDWRDGLIRLSLLRISASELGADPPAVFRQAATSLNPDSRDWLLAFLQRSEALNRIEAMGYELVADAEGQQYRPIPPPWQQGKGPS